MQTTPPEVVLVALPRLCWVGEGAEPNHVIKLNSVVYASSLQDQCVMTSGGKLQRAGYIHKCIQ